jgi:hypothetical protein
VDLVRHVEGGGLGGDELFCFFLFFWVVRGSSSWFGVCDGCCLGVICLLWGINWCGGGMGVGERVGLV